jgi:hypothetical protein
MSYILMHLEPEASYRKWGHIFQILSDFFVKQVDSDYIGPYEHEFFLLHLKPEVVHWKWGHIYQILSDFLI